MTRTAPPFKIQSAAGKEIQNADDVVEYVKEALDQHPDWHAQEGQAGWALVHLFGRLTELALNRLNQVPDKYFLAFLNQAGVDLLPPRPATTELTFIPAEDGPAFIQVPAGTQVTTIQTETQPEIIFETQRDIIVAPNAVTRCFAFDPLSYADCTTLTTGQVTSAFSVFKGQQERERLLYLGDDELFGFDDEASRHNATVTLSFEFAVPGDPIADGGWRLEWLYWDGVDWKGLEEAGATVKDNTDNFSQDQTVVLKSLPELGKPELNEETGLGIACKVTGGTARDHLPVLSSVTGEREIKDLSGEGTTDIAFSALQSGTAFVPLDPTGEFFPLGQHPGRLDTFYLRADEAFSKQGAAITLEMDLEGVNEPGDETELSKLEVEWQYHGEDGWISLGISKYTNGVENQQWNFEDTTNAFTASSSQVVKSTVTFTVPKFEEANVNDEKGYWLRARVLQGSYDEPGKLPNENTWLPPKTYAPLISNLNITYSGYSESKGSKPIDSCHSWLDEVWRHHYNTDTFFSPFYAVEEGPALYLGFRQAFPPEKWIQLLLDVQEEKETSATIPAVFWEYWNGSRWATLRVSDGSRGLSERGYLGFFGPDKHPASAEFGQTAHWLRARPARAHPRPLAQAGEDQPISLKDGEATTVNLDASGSRAFRGHRIAKYTWLLSSTFLEANAGSDQTAPTTGDEASVELDASGSKHLAGGSIEHYIWRKIVEPEEPDEETAPAAPGLLKAVRLNTVPALNAVTITEETLGSSNGKEAQSFSLLRTPVLSDVQISVREPDRPPKGELQQLQKELLQTEEKAQALSSTEGEWVRWHQVPDFFNSTPASRHFTLDPISGQVRFGNGKQGHIPPIGLNNVKAVFYHTHDGDRGNVKSGTITVLRNPTGDLVDIKTVTNPEAAAGGSAAETVEEVRRRGPQRLKHRQRTVTVEDFAWLAREASGEVNQAHCLPTRNALGLPEAGWVTMVITPDSTEAKPTPSPALLRQVEDYIKNHALTNLKGNGQIHVKGPEYIEATVLARVVPVDPTKSDTVELAILKRLQAFLHPLRGGPERSGWALGRDVYLSEIYDEIETVLGVDHVAGLRLLSSSQQARLILAKENQAGEAPAYRNVPFDLPVGSQVSDFEERIKWLLAEPVFKPEDPNETVPLTHLAIHGFKVGDAVNVVRGNNTALVTNLTIATVSGANITFNQPFTKPIDWNTRDALLSSDGRLRLALVGDGISTDSNGKVNGVTVQGFQTGDKVSVVVGTRRDPILEFLPLEAVEPCEDRIFVPEGHLIYSGDHDIEMVLE